VKVAWYSPLPPERSGIADYSALLLPELRTRIEVEPVKRGRTKPAGDADLAVYHIGNDPDAHGWIVDALRLRSGVVVLHEFVLHHLVAGITLGRRNGIGYLDAMEREAGLAGRLLAYGVLEGRLPSLWEARPTDFPLAAQVLDYASGLVVHSRYVEDRARAAGFEGQVWRVPHPAWEPPPLAAAEAQGAPLIGCFGYLNPSKRIPQLLQAFTRLLETHPHAKLLLVGATGTLFDLDGRLERAGLLGSPSIVREEFVDEPRLWSLMAACDVCVSLRAPTMGETSGIAIRALSLGKPLVVSDLGWFSELPDEVALKVPVDEHEVDTIAAELELLADEEGRRTEMGLAARAHAEREHGLANVADLYAAALEEAAGGRAVRDAVIHEVARAAAEVALPELEAARVGVRLRETGL
jgi:glycosyltransferase involved in cell wall biosynthesis